MTWSKNINLKNMFTKRIVICQIYDFFLLEKGMYLLKRILPAFPGTNFVSHTGIISIGHRVYIGTGL